MIPMSSGEEYGTGHLLFSGEKVCRLLPVAAQKLEGFFGTPMACDLSVLSLFSHPDRTGRATVFYFSPMDAARIRSGVFLRPGSCQNCVVWVHGCTVSFLMVRTGRNEKRIPTRKLYFLRNLLPGQVTIQEGCHFIYQCVIRVSFPLSFVSTLNKPSLLSWKRRKSSGIHSQRIKGRIHFFLLARKAPPQKPCARSIRLVCNKGEYSIKFFVFLSLCFSERHTMLESWFLFLQLSFWLSRLFGHICLLDTSCPSRPLSQFFLYFQMVGLTAIFRKRASRHGLSSNRDRTHTSGYSFVNISENSPVLQ